MRGRKHLAQDIESACDHAFPNAASQDPHAGWLLLLYPAMFMGRCLLAVIRACRDEFREGRRKS